jgi:hypothetical protein
VLGFNTIVFHSKVKKCIQDRQIDPLKKGTKKMKMYVCMSDKSAVTDYCTESGHWIKSQETEVSAKTSGYMDQLLKEATEIKVRQDNINREGGFRLSKA